MRQPSYTKRGPGRRPAHVNKLLAVFYAVAQEALRLAKDARDSGKSPSGLAWLVHNTTWHAIWHDDRLSHRKGAVIRRARYGGDATRFIPTIQARATLG